MNTINVENCKTLLIGRRGENEVTTVAFDFTEWASEFGSGVVDLYVKRFGDDSAYPVFLTIDGTVASWLVTETDTNVAGYGKAEYVYRVDGKIAKSAVFPFFVAEDIGQPASEPPDPYESWLEQLTALGAETEANAQAAEQSAENASESAEDAAQSAASAEDYAGQAETAAGLAQTAQTASEAAKTAAQTAQSAAEDAAADAQQAAQQAHVEYEQLSGEVDDLSDEVAQQKSAIEDLEALTSRKAGMLVDTASGAIASFVPDATVPNMLGVSVAVEPVQDLHGYDSPWPGGGGTNLLDPGISKTLNGVTKTVNSDGTITFTGTATTTTDFYFNGTAASYTDYSLPNGTYHIEGSERGGSPTYDFFWIYQQAGTTKYANGHDHTPVTVDGPIPSRIFFRVYPQYTINLTVKLGLFAGNYQSNSWTPYSNECPISGWDSVDIMHSGADTTDPTTYTIALGQTVYGGTLTIAEDGSVNALVDRAMVDLATLLWRRNAGDTYYFSTDLYQLAKRPTADGILAKIIFEKYASLPSRAGGIYPDRPDAISLNRNGNLYTTATVAPTGFCVYELAEPVTITLDPVTISTISGQTNNVWADAGDVAVEYAADLKTYIDQKIAAAVAALS